MQAAQQAETASDLRKSSSASNPRRAEMRVLKAQEGFARLASGAIVLAALVLTYEGTMRFCQRHGALGWRGALIAGMNDLAVLVGILWPQRLLQGIAALCSVFTIWANLDHAAAGPAGLAVALIPPALAIMMVAALEQVIRRVEAEPVAEPVSQEADSPEPVATQPESLHLVEWTPESVRTLAESMTTAQIVSHTGLSKSTVNRYKKVA
jgi:hypothetical protein